MRRKGEDTGVVLAPQEHLPPIGREMMVGNFEIYQSERFLHLVMAVYGGVQDIQISVMLVPRLRFVSQRDGGGIAVLPLCSP